MVIPSAQHLQPTLAAWRRHLHAHPEVSYEEAETSAFLKRHVAALGLAITPVPDRHGFWVDLGPGEGPRLLLRADMDALPIAERNTHDFASQRPGAGHLCGHDFHSAWLLGAATLLARRAGELPRGVRLLFQHSEEEPGGAKDCIAAGALEGVDRCFALHVSPEVPLGQMALRVGGLHAGSTKFTLTITGRGGHGARPHECADPILAQAAIIQGLQHIVSRRTDPLDCAVVTVGMIQGGEAYNAIPSTVTLIGTARGHSVETVDRVSREIEEVARAIAGAHGCSVACETIFGGPPLQNDPQAIAALTAAGRAVLGEENVLEAPRRMGGEDFAFIAQERPSAFGLLGGARPDRENPPLHHPRFDPDEEALWRGAAILATVALRGGAT
ncbi:MAG: M20 family metallopeptidase [Sumerlaeia bacterium]